MAKNQKMVDTRDEIFGHCVLFWKPYQLTKKDSLLIKISSEAQWALHIKSEG